MKNSIVMVFFITSLGSYITKSEAIALCRMCIRRGNNYNCKVALHL
jgi:hypothetical protein